MSSNRPLQKMIFGNNRDPWKALEAHRSKCQHQSSSHLQIFCQDGEEDQEKQWKEEQRKVFQRWTSIQGVVSLPCSCVECVVQGKVRAAERGWHPPWDDGEGGDGQRGGWGEGAAQHDGPQWGRELPRHFCQASFPISAPLWLTSCPGVRVKLMLMMQSRARSRSSAGTLATSMLSGLILQASSSTQTRWFQFRTGKKQTDIQYFPEKHVFIPIHVKWFKQCTNKQLYQSILASVFKALRLWILPEPPEPSRTLHSLKESWEINVLDGIIMAWYYQLSEFFYTE